MSLQVSKNLQWESLLFQQDLIAAEKMAGLYSAKKRFDQKVRVKAMDAWKADGQYPLFEIKVENLKKAVSLI